MAVTDTTAGLVEDEERAQLSTADINDLPDSAFAYIEDGGEKDAEGKTTPRSLRHFPIHDKAHVQNALARAPQSPFGDKAMPKILAAAKKFGIDVSENHDAEDEAVERRRAVAERLLGRKMPERRSVDTGPIEVRESDDGKLRITGYASVFDRPYDMGHYVETVRRGAFKKTLAESPQVHLLVNHSGLPLASTLNDTLALREDGIGLRYDAVLDPDDPDSQVAVKKIRSGLLQQSSFAFTPIRQEWSKDYAERSLVELSIDRGDVSVVNFGASHHTSVQARSLDAVERSLIRDVADLVEMETRAGASISGERLAKLNGVLRLIADADRNLDEAQPELAEIIGVANPDEPDEPDEPDDDGARADETELEERASDDEAEVPVEYRAYLPAAVEIERLRHAPRRAA